jgi:hypothetical protein
MNITDLESVLLLGLIQLINSKRDSILLFTFKF